MWDQISAHIGQITGRSFAVSDRQSISGGSINQAYSLSDGDRTYFVKLNQASQVAMFEAEALGLQQIYDTNTIRVPAPICWGIADRSAYIVLEWLDLGRGERQAWEVMGRNLAAMHQVSSDRGFGWDQNNTIGSTPQVNTWTEDWVEFFTKHRLGYQFSLANRQGGRFPQQEQLLAAVPDILAGHQPSSSLVHGDLWTGNAAVTKQGEPVILDPATYFGDREVDLAMSQLFGSFPANFYNAYNEVLPLAAGYQQRKVLYNLYHILNHFNLFGGSYEYQANQMMATLL
ncbi:MAG: fructosamine kinase family protein [Elainellaceae cyanobacterium]